MTKTTLRLPDELYAEVEQLAKTDLRSINAELVWLLEQAVAARRS